MTVLTTVTGDGWQANSLAPVDLDFSPVSLTRQGFDATGAATSHAESVVTTARIRMPWYSGYPSTASAAWTGMGIALSDYVYSTDTVSGVVNSSMETSPKPVAAWTMPDRLVVGNSLTVRCAAFHRNGRTGKPVACVEFTATDGTTTITSKVATPSLTTDPLTGNAIVEYVATIDITTLTDNTNITVNAKVYPWIGAAGSVLDSSALSNQYDFSPRTYRKNTARAASPYIVLIKSTGNDSTGVVDTSTSTGKAACLTLTGAINRARSVLGTGAGALDGVEFWLDAGTWSRSATPTANTVNAAIVIKPIPGVAKASCIFQFGAASNGFGLAHVRLTGLTVQRAGGFYANLTAGTCAVDDCAWDWNGNTSTTIAASATAVNFYFTNIAFNAATSGIGLAGGTGMAIAMVRGCTGGAANSTASYEMLCWVGNAMLGGGLNNGSARAQDNRVVAFNRFLSVGASSVSSIVGINNNTSATGFAVVQNLFEYTATGTAQRSLMPSGDSATPSITHLIVWQNTFAGFDGYGRGNLLYDETPGTLGDASKRRYHKLQSFIGNIHVQINTKSDRFCGANGIADAPNRLGNWPYSYGVGVRGEFSIYRDAGNGVFLTGIIPDYHGLNANIGTTNTGVGNDPKFTDNRATTSGPTAGAGGGTYTLQTGSPAKALVTNSPIPYAMDGTARAATDDAGAYATGTTAVSHATSGTLTAGTATVAGSAARTRQHAATGGLTGPGSVIVGTAVHLALHATTGALVAPGMAITGSAARTRQHETTGTLPGQTASITGAASRSALHAASGAFVAAGPSITGNAARTRQHAASGTLGGQTANITGAALRSLGPVSHATSGTLNAGSAAITASAARLRQHATSGTLGGQTGNMAGLAARTRLHGAEGSLTGAGAALTGSAARVRSHEASGALVGPAAGVAGTARHQAAHGAVGSLVAPAAILAGSADRVPAEGLTVRPDRLIPGDPRNRIVYGIARTRIISGLDQ